MTRFLVLHSCQTIANATLKETRSKFKTNKTPFAILKKPRSSLEQKLEYGLDKIEKIPQLELIDTSLRQEQELEIQKLELDYKSRSRLRIKYNWC